MDIEREIEKFFFFKPSTTKFVGFGLNSKGDVSTDASFKFDSQKNSAQKDENYA